MSSVSGFSGVYAVDWAQVTVADAPGLLPEDMAVGLSWRWSGACRRLDGPTPALLLDNPRATGTTRARVRQRAERLAIAVHPSGRDMTRVPPLTEAEDGGLSGAALDPAAAPQGEGFVLTDGKRLYPARVVRARGRVLAVFAPLLPPEGRDLWITRAEIGATPPREAMGVICFLPGARIDTPKGPVAIESLRPGALVSTRDNGAVPVTWMGETALSGAELYLHPHLRPVRIAAGALGGGTPAPDLMVSPGHRLLRPAPQAMGGEVLIAAQDMVDGRAVRRDFGCTSARYIHLMLERHEIITANGVPCESFHPALAGGRVLQWHARTLERALPGITRDPWALGDPARRCLDRGEAAIVAATAGA